MMLKTECEHKFIEIKNLSYEDFIIEPNLTISLGPLIAIPLYSMKRYYLECTNEMSKKI